MASDRDPFAGLPPASAAGTAVSGSGLDAPARTILAKSARRSARHYAIDPDH